MIARNDQWVGNINSMIWWHERKFFFIPKNETPKGKIATHIKTVCTIRPYKSETYRVRIAAGISRAFCHGENSTTM